MKHYLVIGRLWSNDEDTHLSLQAQSSEAAKAAFVEDMWDYKGVGSEDRERLESNGEGAFINGIFESETEIKEST